MVSVVPGLPGKAIAAAVANAARNDVAAHVDAGIGDAASFVTDPAPLVVANIIAAVHRRLADRYARYLAPGGRLILGGILDAEADELASALASQGWRRDAAVSLDGWTTLVLARDDG